MFKHLASLLCLFFCFGSAAADEHLWYSNFSLDATHGVYEKSGTLNAVSGTALDTVPVTGTSASILYDLSYLERFGFALKATQAIFKLNDNAPDSIQNKIALLIHQKSNFDPLNGAINSSLAIFSVTGANTTATFAISPEFYYLNNSQTFLLGGGYAYSSYGGRGNSRVNVNQYTASLGFNPYFFSILSNVWIASKGYFIETKNKNNEAYSIKLNWKVNGNSRLLPKSYLIGSLTGSRRYAVEQETLLIYNIEDEQSDSYFISANWNIVDNGYLAITAGTEQYRSESNNQKYNYNFINASLSKTW